jgi:hypothetical protein
MTRLDEINMLVTRFAIAESRSWLVRFREISRRRQDACTAFGWSARP